MSELTDDQLRDIVDEIGKRLYDNIPGASKDNNVRGGFLYRLWVMVERDVIRRVRAERSLPEKAAAVIEAASWAAQSADAIG